MMDLGYSTVDLEWLKVKVRNVVSEEFLASVSAEVIREEVWGRLIVQLTARVLAEQLPPESETATGKFTFYVPSSWWQAVKDVHEDSWWLAWFVRRWPVKSRQYVREGKLTVHLKRYWTYPNAKVLPPNGYGQPVRAAILNRDVRWWAP